MPPNRTPRSSNVPSQYDSGNVRAICYGVDNGLGPEELSRFLTELNATAIEVTAAIKIYADYYGEGQNSVRVINLKKAFEFYSKDGKVDAHKEPCFECKKPCIFWNLLSIEVKEYSKDESKMIQVCVDCYKKLEKNKAQCRKHKNISLIGSSNVECPLYPKKCSPVGYCHLPECLHVHMEKIHKGYAERRWRKSKRFLSKTSGEFIKSDLMTGIEYEVIGKNNASTRTNIFKLGKSIGIDNDHSIRQFYLNTELVTPPASGIKLEDMVYKTANALQKDGFTANHRCGLHIHIDCFNKYGHINQNPDFYKSLLAAYCLYQTVFYSIVPKSRAHNPNIRSINELYINLLVDTKFTANSKFSKIWYRTNNNVEVMQMRGMKRHETKYCWANFHSLLRREGLEIRLHEGTTDPKAILMWTRLNHDFIEAVAKQPKLYLSVLAEATSLNPMTIPNRIVKFTKFINADPQMSAYIAERYKQHINSKQELDNDLSDASLASLMEVVRSSPGGFSRPQSDLDRGFTFQHSPNGLRIDDGVTIRGSTRSVNLTRPTGSERIVNIDSGYSNSLSFLERNARLTQENDN